MQNKNNDSNYITNTYTFNINNHNNDDNKITNNNHRNNNNHHKLY